MLANDTEDHGVLGPSGGYDGWAGGTPAVPRAARPAHGQKWIRQLSERRQLCCAAADNLDRVHGQDGFAALVHGAIGDGHETAVGLGP